MSEQMTFPERFDQFVEQYKMVDKECVYSNGIEYIPVFRVKQWLGNLDEIINRLESDVEKAERNAEMLENMYSELIDEKAEWHKKDRGLVEKSRLEAVTEFAHYIIDQAQNGVIYTCDIPDYVQDVIGEWDE